MLGRFNKIQICLLGFCLVCAVPARLSAESLAYTVKKGDTLYGIAKKFNVPVQNLKDANRLKDADALLPGVSLSIPDMYTVKKGDTLYGIAKKFGISIDDLLASSGRKKDDPLKAGDSLYIPSRSALAVKPSADTPAAKTESQGGGAAVAVQSTKSAETRPEVKAPSVTQNDELYYWPVTGERSFQDGKLPRIVIHGKPGTPIVSIAPGRIIWVGVWGIFGRTVFVQSKSGYVYIYAGNNNVSAKVGEEVSRGMEIGTLGENDESDPVLHFFVYKDGKPVHPEKAPRG